MSRRGRAFHWNRREVLHGLMGTAVAGPTLYSMAAKAEDPPDLGIAWVCPMHPDYIAQLPGVCPRCGMTLIQTRPYDTRDYILQFHTEPVAVLPGKTVKLFFRFYTPDGKIVTHFEPVHTKYFHLFVISQDMEFFEHIHPVMAEDGTWTIDTVLPKEGYYKVLCDTLPSGGSSQFLTAPLVTANYKGDIYEDRAHLVPDKSPTSTVGDLTVTVSLNPKQAASCQYVHLNYYLTDTATQKPVIDLQTYLGAFGHMLIMSDDLEEYVHSHPLNLIAQDERESVNDVPEYIIPPDADLEKIRGGPSVTFEGLMPKPAMYRAWAQFRRHDIVHDFAFTFNVVQGTADPVLT